MGGGRRGEREKGGRSGEGEGGEATIWNPSRWVRKISLVGVIIKKYVSLRSEPHRHVSLLSLSSLYLPLYLAAASLSLALSLSLSSRNGREYFRILYTTQCVLTTKPSPWIAIAAERTVRCFDLFSLVHPEEGGGGREWFARALLLIGVYHRFARHARRNLSLPSTGTRPAKFKNFKPRKV